MFTGLVEATGAISARVPSGPGVDLRVETALPDLIQGESVSVNGACLTVAKLTSGGFSADVSSETLRCTTLGELPLGTAVNLERALLPTSRLGGHIVSGHVDAVTSILEGVPSGEAVQVWFRLPPNLARFVANKGSIAIDGVSLTVNDVTADRFSVMLIPHTRACTNLSSLAPGKRVNLEVDTLARYVARQLDVPAEGNPWALLEKLKGAGFA